MRRSRSVVVTAAIEDIAFSVPIVQGDLVEVNARVDLGRPHEHARPGRGEQGGRRSRARSELCTVGHFTMVAIGDDRRPVPVPPEGGAAGA